MIKHLHLNNTTSYKNRRTKPVVNSKKDSLVAKIAGTLLQPREQAILAILSKASLMK